MDAIKESNRIQKEIRKRSIIVPKSFPGGTLDVSLLHNTDGQRVFADSYGPFSPEDYFSPGTLRIMFILKESFIGSADEEIAMTEGHDKAREYRSICWSDLEPTYQNIAKMTFSIVENERYSESPYRRDLALSYMIKHVCIVNANFFPCVGGKYSNNNKIYDWAKINAEDIQRQFELYHPDIVIGGNTLSHFVSDVIGGKECRLLGEQVTVLGQRQIRNFFNMDPGNNDSYYNARILMVNMKHPSIYDSSELLLAIWNWWKSCL